MEKGAIFVCRRCMKWEPPLGREILQEWQNTISHTGSQAKSSIDSMLAWQCAVIVEEDGT